MRQTHMLAIVALVPALGSVVGCTRIRVKEPVQIESFDAISPEPVADARGIASIDSIQMVDDAWWHIQRGNAAERLRAPYFARRGLRAALSIEPSRGLTIQGPSPTRLPSLECLGTSLRRLAGGPAPRS